MSSPKKKKMNKAVLRIVAPIGLMALIIGLVLSLRTCGADVPGGGGEGEQGGGKNEAQKDPGKVPKLKGELLVMVEGESCKHGDQQAPCICPAAEDGAVAAGACGSMCDWLQARADPSALITIDRTLGQEKAVDGLWKCLESSGFPNLSFKNR